MSCKTLKHVDIQLYQSNQTQVLKNKDHRYYKKKEQTSCFEKEN